MTAAAVTILAGGLATRMGPTPTGIPKFLLPIRDSTIGDRLADDIHDAGLRLRIVIHPDDRHIRRWSTAWTARVGAEVELIPVPPGPYGTVLATALADLRQSAVIDGDLVLPEGQLAAFLRHAAHNPRHTDLTCATTRQLPADHDPRTIWFDADRVGRAVESRHTRLTGVYWLRAAVVADLHEFVAARGHSFGQFLAQVGDRRTIDGFEISGAYNVNTPAELATADDAVTCAVPTSGAR